PQGDGVPGLISHRLLPARLSEGCAALARSAAKHGLVDRSVLVADADLELLGPVHLAAVAVLPIPHELLECRPGGPTVLGAKPLPDLVLPTPGDLEDDASDACGDVLRGERDEVDQRRVLRRSSDDAITPIGQELIRPDQGDQL